MATWLRAEPRISEAPWRLRTRLPLGKEAGCHVRQRRGRGVSERGARNPRTELMLMGHGVWTPRTVGYGV